MEAMQNRGNRMMEGADPPLFPSNFLGAGARIGLVGGSDHCRAAGPNRFCLTGLWVRQITGEAVLEALRSRRTVATATVRSRCGRGWANSPWAGV